MYIHKGKKKKKSSFSVRETMSFFGKYQLNRKIAFIFARAKLIFVFAKLIFVLDF